MLRGWPCVGGWVVVQTADFETSQMGDPPVVAFCSVFHQHGGMSTDDLLRRYAMACAVVANNLAVGAHTHTPTLYI